MSSAKGQRESFPNSGLLWLPADYSPRSAGRCRSVPSMSGVPMPAEAAVVSVVRGTGRIVRRQIVKRRGNSRRVEIVPERDALDAGSSVFAVYGFRRGIERSTLLVRMSVHEIKDAVRARSGPVDEVGPGHRALRGNAGPQVTEAAGRTQLGKIGQQALRSSCFRTARGSIPSMPMMMTFVPLLRETRRRLPSQ